MALPADLALREATRADVGAVAALVVASSASFAAWAPETWRPPVVEFERAYWWGRLPGDHTRRTAVAVEAGDGRMVGVVSWAQAVELAHPPVPVPGIAHVSALFVDAARRRQGVAAALLGRAEAQMREAGFVRAELWTPADAPARRFYEARGWILDGRSEFSPELGLPIVGYGKRVTG